jgi:hypothetical protein
MLLIQSATAGECCHPGDMLGVWRWTGPGGDSLIAGPCVLIRALSGTGSATHTPTLTATTRRGADIRPL